MAGTIIADKIQTENSFLTLNVGATQIATMNTSGIYSSSGTKMIGTDGTIGVATIANTAITGNIISSQIAPSVTLTTPIISGNLNLDSAGTTGVRVPSANTITFHTAGTEDVRIDANGNVGVGTSSPTEKLDVRANATFGSAVGTDASIHIQSGYDVGIKYLTRLTTDFNGVFSIRTGSTATANTPSSAVISERMRIDSSGSVFVGRTSDTDAAGITIAGDGLIRANRDGGIAIIANRNTNDGTIIDLRQGGFTEGTITVSGTTVSYNGGHLARWSQLPDNSKDDTILKGTVLTNLNDMCVWTKDGETLPNEQLNKMKVSDVDGDTNVAGVFVNWTRDEDCNSDDMNVAMTGDMIIRIAQGVTVARGDLLMSAGNGTAKPQGDDIRRSKTIAKVTSTHVTCTYADGSYCVPCVLMAC